MGKAEARAATRWTASARAEHERTEECRRCGIDTSDPVMIGAVETGSGPGGIVYACIPCAREYAGFWYAPDWLREELAKRGEER